MKHATRGVLTALALTVLSPSAALAIGTQERPGYTFSRTPSHGKPGTVIHVEGTGCEYQGKPYEYAKVYLFYREKNGSVTTEAEGKYDIAHGGSFSGDLTVPEDARAGRYLMDATCYASDMAFHVADSDFTVDGPSPTSTPTSTPTPSPSRTTPTPSSRPTPSRTSSVRPSASHTPTPRPTPSRTTARALPSPTPVLTSPSPTAVASSQPADPHDSPPGALVMAAAVLIAANGLGLGAIGRRA